MVEDDGTLTWVAGRGPAAPLAARIRVVGAAATPASYLLRSGTCRIGSSPTSDVCIQDATVSRQHAELELVAEGIAVRDLGSRNGTFFLDQKVDRITVSLGTQLRIGRIVVEILADDDALGALPPFEGRSYGELVGSSQAMRRVFSRLQRLEGTLVPVLVEGESGVGKELVARALHDHSKLRDKPFVAVNCGAIPRELIASELFGHKRGAFTGAVDARRGAFESADGGTLFLDELGELPLDVQPMLLRALESGEIRQVGSDQAKNVKVRLICATNRALEESVANGEFREDLFYRVAVVRVVVPPLRERLDDLEELAQRFANQSEAPPLPAPIVASLRARPWPGNVRQLRNAVIAYVALGELPPAPSRSAGDTSLTSFVDVATPYPELKDRLVDAFTAIYLRELMAHAKGNQTVAAKVAGLDRSYLGRLLAKFGIDPREPQKR